MKACTIYLVDLKVLEAIGPKQEFGGAQLATSQPQRWRDR